MSPTPYYEDDAVCIYHGDCREVLEAGIHLADLACVIADPPYGETSLKWDRWPDGWVDVVARFPKSIPLWCFGSMRMFLDHHAEAYCEAAANRLSQTAMDFGGAA